MAAWTTHKTLPGDNVVKKRTPDPTGAAGKAINDNFIALANALEAMAARAGTKFYYGQIAGVSGDSDEALAGDYFLDTDDGNLYTLVGTTWTLVTCLKGTAGASGAPGAQGPAGSAPFSTISVSALAAGAQPTAEISGDELQLGIPSGATGAQGPAGADASAGWTTATDATTTPTLTLADAMVYNLTNSAITTISLDLATGADVARVMFLSGASAPSIDDPVDGSSNPLWTWIGDNCTDGVFSPAATTEYDCVIESTPRGVIATVKGWK